MGSPIDKAKMITYIKDELKNVSKMKQQLTFDEIDKLEAEYSKKEILETLEAMENHAPLTKKYLSVYRTLRSWMNMERKRQQEKKGYELKRLGLNAKMEHAEALTYLERKGIPASQIREKFNPVKDPNGKTYWHLKQD